jgi:hypothetical protein
MYLSSGNLEAWNSWSPKGLFRPVQGLLYLYIPLERRDSITYWYGVIYEVKVVLWFEVTWRRSMWKDAYKKWVAENQEVPYLHWRRHGETQGHKNRKCLRMGGRRVTNQYLNRESSRCNDVLCNILQQVLHPPFCFKFPLFQQPCLQL